ncbi:hypothetical protein J4446_02750 [Candidatus Woesearchaeota archaeon]|nr:hypothetical protein [Candidatus Woesearchaeota archaeon]
MATTYGFKDLNSYLEARDISSENKEGAINIINHAYTSFVGGLDAGGYEIIRKLDNGIVVARSERKEVSIIVKKTKLNGSLDERVCEINMDSIDSNEVEILLLYFMNFVDITSIPK